MADLYCTLPFVVSVSTTEVSNSSEGKRGMADCLYKSSAVHGSGLGVADLLQLSESGINGLPLFSDGTVSRGFDHTLEPSDTQEPCINATGEPDSSRRNGSWATIFEAIDQTAQEPYLERGRTFIQKIFGLIKGDLHLSN